MCEGELASACGAFTGFMRILDTVAATLLSLPVNGGGNKRG